MKNHNKTGHGLDTDFVLGFIDKLGTKLISDFNCRGKVEQDVL